MRGFDLFGFFWRQRRYMLRFSDTKPEPEDEVRAQVAALVGHLVTVGADILKGEKAWQADYGMESSPVRELEPFSSRPRLRLLDHCAQLERANRMMRAA